MTICVYTPCVYYNRQCVYSVYTDSMKKLLDKKGYPIMIPVPSDLPNDDAVYIFIAGWNEAVASMEEARENES